MMRLPAPPTLDELDAQIPRIEPVAPGVYRPMWSVMIPTYNSGRFLRRTLESVLAEDQGPERMQIEVVDGCSTEDDPESLVREIGRGRVAFHRLPQNRGAPATFNAALSRSSGRLVHLLHGDDLVLPGFYEAYAAELHAHPDVHTVIGQSVLIDEHDRWRGLFGPRPPVGGGVMHDFAVRQATDHLVQAPAIVARRDVYEAIGGYCAWFNHVPDWDMWFRLGHFGPVACVPRPYALFRVHDQSYTVRSRMMVSATNVRECYSVINANLARLGRTTSISTDNGWHARLAAKAEVRGWELDRSTAEGRYNQFAWAWMLDPSPRRLVQLAKSWLKYRLAQLTAGASTAHHD